MTKKFEIIEFRVANQNQHSILVKILLDIVKSSDKLLKFIIFIKINSY